VVVVAEATGGTVTASFSVAVVLSVITGQGLSAVWSVFNALQILYYLPLMDVSLPENYVQVLGYLEITEFSFLPDTPKILRVGGNTNNDGKRLPARFADFGYDTEQFVVNGWEYLSMFFVFGTILASACLIHKIAPKLKFIGNLVQDMKWSTFIRLIIESYIDTMVAIFMQLKFGNYQDQHHYYSITLSVILLVQFTLLIGVIVWMSFSKRDKISEKGTFFKVWGSLFEEFVTSSVLSLEFYALFLLRRLGFSALIVFLPEHGLLQAIFAASLSLIILSYMIIIKPYLVRGDGIVNTFTEAAVTVTFCFFPFFKVYESSLSPPSTARDVLGYVLIVLVVGIVILNFAYIFANFGKKAWNRYTQRKKISTSSRKAQKPGKSSPMPSILTTPSLEPILFSSQDELPGLVKPKTPKAPMI